MEQESLLKEEFGVDVKAIQSIGTRIHKMFLNVIEVMDNILIV